MTLDDTQEQLAGDLLDGLRPRSQRTLRARVAYHRHRQPILALLGVVAIGLLVLSVMAALGEQLGFFAAVVYFALDRFGPAAREARRRDQASGEASRRTYSTGYEPSVPDAGRVAELVESTPPPEARSLRILRRGVVSDLAERAALIGLSSWVLASPRWTADLDDPTWLWRVLAAVLLIACVKSSIDDVVRSWRDVAAAARAITDGTATRHVGRVIGERGDKPVVLLAAPGTPRLALRADAGFAMPLAQDDEVVLDGDLRPDALVAVTAGGRTEWVTVFAFLCRRDPAAHRDPTGRGPS